MATRGMRRRRKGHSAGSEQSKEAMQEKLQRHHPLRLDGEVKLMPHELDEIDFIEWKILNGMTDEGYEESVRLGDAFLADIRENGRPIPTDKLTDDQKGWAKSDYYEHYTNEFARWKPVPGKASKVVPYKVKLMVRDRQYNEHCSCPSGGLDTMEDGVVPPPDMQFWGTRWDDVPLYQCQNCGEVVLSKTNAELAIAIGEELRNNDNKEDNTNDDS